MTLLRERMREDLRIRNPSPRTQECYLGHVERLAKRAELQGKYHYPLNIQGNTRPELVAFVRYLKSTRSAYKRRFLKSSAQPT